MSLAVTSRAQPSPPPALTADLWPLSVEQYHAMIRAGILTADDPVELLAGYLVTRMPKNPHHRVATRLVRSALERLVPAGWYVDSQEPITLFDSEPEPDVLIVRGDTRHYLDRHPGAADLALVVEVSDATLERDRTLKMRLYAQSGVAEYWIVNLPQQQLEIYSDPRPDEPDYGHRQILGPEGEAPVSVDGAELGQVSVREILP